MRLNSPSSIITYLQCPRLYYYKYVERKESFLHIDILKGSIVHLTLKEFFLERPPMVTKNYSTWASERLKSIFYSNWNKKKEEMRKLILGEEELTDHKNDCWGMLNNWLDEFLERINSEKIPFNEAFNKLKPLTEEEFFDEELNLKGYIDAIENNDGKIRIIDYKTSSNFDITKDQKLQLSIYAYLYFKKYGKIPSEIGVYFLREKLHLISLNQFMLDHALEICKDIIKKTESNDIKDYPFGEGYLCKKLGERCPCHKYEDFSN